MTRVPLNLIIRLIKKENITIAGGYAYCGKRKCWQRMTVKSRVPTMVSDMIESSIAGYPLEGLLFGGSPAPSSLVPRAQKAFPTATMCDAFAHPILTSYFAEQDTGIRNDWNQFHRRICKLRISLTLLPPEAFARLLAKTTSLGPQARWWLQLRSQLFELT